MHAAKLVTAADPDSPEFGIPQLISTVSKYLPTAAHSTLSSRPQSQRLLLARSGGTAA